MFSKTPDPTTSPAMPSAPRAGQPSSNTIEVLGEIEGNLTARGLIVGAEGRVAGTVQAETVEVKGKLDGRVATHAFALRASAEVAADVAYTTLVIESGAQIEGKFTLNKA